MKKIIMLLVLSVIILSSCESENYKLSMKSGNELMTSRNYTAAISDFTKALSEKANDKKAKSGIEEARNAIKSSNLLDDANGLFKKKDYIAAQKSLKLITNITPVGIEDKKVLDEANSLISQVEKVIEENIASIKSEMEQANIASSNSKYLEAISKLKKVLSTNIINEQTKPLIAQAQNNLKLLTLAYWKSYIGSWGDVKSTYWGYENIEIIGVDDMKIKFKLFSVSDPPASRIANIETDATITNETTAEFSFDNDGWDNKGEGVIHLQQNSINVTTKITNPSQDKLANWRMADGTLVYARIDEAKKEEAHQKEEKLKKTELEAEQKRQARVTQKIGSLTIIITDILYSQRYNVSQIYYNVINDANSNDWNYALWTYEFYDESNNLISKSQGGTNALKPGTGIKNNSIAKGDIRNYAYFKMSNINQGKVAVPEDRNDFTR